MRVLLLLLVICMQVQGQPVSDAQLILNKPTEGIRDVTRKPVFGFSRSTHWYHQYNPLNLGAASLMYLYQKFVSPQISATCGFSPSCSAMSKNLIADFGLVKGVFCSADRLTRCNRISFADLEPDEINPSDGKVHEETSRYK